MAGGTIARRRKHRYIMAGGTIARRRKHRYDAAEVLERAGMTRDHAEQLLRIERQLHRWHEWECGTERGGIERDEKTGALTWYDSESGKHRPYRGPDHETLALNRLKKIMASYPTLGFYVQGDPRGCALYILRPGDVPAGEQADAHYSRGIAVYRE